MKKSRKVNGLLIEFDKKIQKLKKEPENIGKRLHGELHLSRSTRLYGKHRLIFQIDEKNKRVYLGAIDHRKDVY